MLDEMRMRTACFARAPQRCTSRLSRYFLLTFQEVTPLSKTRNQLVVILWVPKQQRWSCQPISKPNGLYQRPGTIPIPQKRPYNEKLFSHDLEGYCSTWND